MTKQPALHDSPTVLLATLFAARRSGDGALALLMTRRLEKLGIRVTFGDAVKPPSRKGVRHAR